MPIVKKIGVQNLRGLEQTGLIEIKPITLLVGKNSAGKSSFARIFPLLKQSSEAKRNAPFLWWGQYVDYGSFSQALRRNAEEKEICFSFEVGLNSTGIQSRLRYSALNSLMTETINLIASVSVREDDGRSYASKITFNLLDLKAEIHIDKVGNVQRIACGNAVWAPSITIGAIVSKGEYLPEILFTQVVEEQIDGTQQKYRRFADFSPLTRNLSNWIRGQIHGNTSPTKIAEIAQRIPLASAERTLEILRGTRRAGSSSWQTFVRQLTVLCGHS